MKLGRLGPSGAERPVVVNGDATYDLSGVTVDIDGDFLASNGIDRARQALEGGELPELSDVAALRVGAPIARPSAVVCVGMNYAEHAAETGSAPPTAPILFLKTPNTVVGPNDAVTIPPGSERTDWEVELAVVIGARAAYLDSVSDAAAYIAGFAVGNDISERQHQIQDSGGQWSKGKCAPGFNPLGPWLVTPDEVEYGKLGLRSWVNGNVRQDSTTSDLIFGVDHLVWSISQYLTLEPGDVIMTGTPQGVALSGSFPFLRAGDVVELEIDGLGRQRQQFVAFGTRGGAV